MRIRVRPPCTCAATSATWIPSVAVAPGRGRVGVRTRARASFRVRARVRDRVRARVRARVVGC